MLEFSSNQKQVFGVVHLKPLPGTPFYKTGDYEASLDKALCDSLTLLENGADGCLLQTCDNVYPCGDDTDYMRVAAMAAIGTEVRKAIGDSFKVGIQIMWNCVTPSLAACKAARADFTRCSALVGSSESPFGTIKGEPLKVLNYRKQIDGVDIGIISEIAGYHYLAGKEINETELLTRVMQSVYMAGAGAVEVYNSDEALNERLVQTIKQAYPQVPVILGGGVNLENCRRRMKYADAALIAGAFETNGFGQKIDGQAVKRIVEDIKSIG